MLTEVRKQVNVAVTSGLLEILDLMCDKDEQSRSGFLRMLIKAEYKRRHQQSSLSKTLKMPKETI